MALLFVSLIGCGDDGPTRPSLADRPPVVTMPTSLTATTGEMIRFDFTVFDPNGDPITDLYATGAWDAFTTGSGKLGGSVEWQACKAGSYTTTITATSGHPSQSGSASAQITVTGTANHYVDILGGAEHYQPDTLVIKNGETVAWRNLDTAGHNATSTSGDYWSTAWIKSGCESRTFTFQAYINPSGPKTYPYVCTEHDGQGTEPSVVIVEP